MLSVVIALKNNVQYLKVLVELHFESALELIKTMKINKTNKLYCNDT